MEWEGQRAPSREAEKASEQWQRLHYPRSAFESVAHLVGEHYGQQREVVERELVETMTIPKQTHSVSVSMDRVSIPMEEPRPPGQAAGAEAAGNPVESAPKQEPDSESDEPSKPKRPVQRVFRQSYAATVTLPASSPAAGSISITGGTKMVFLMPKADGSYAVYVDTMNTLWNGSEMLNIVAAGNVVPAFSATVTAPVTANLTVPTPPPMGARLMVNRSMDLILKWTGGQGDSIQAVLSSPVTAGKTLAVACTFAASGTMGTIPAAVLMNLQAGNGTLTVYSGNVKMMPVGDYDLSVSALSLAIDNKGQAASYGATYQ